MPRKNRVYKKGEPGSEYSYHASKEQKDNRVDRNRARRQAEAAGKVSKGDSKEVDHVKPLSKGGSGSKSNTRVVPKKTNRQKYNKG